VRIPATLAGQLEVEPGTAVELHVEKGALVVRPKARRRFRLSTLLADCKPSQLHGEQDVGRDVGREIVE
jgi:antitoxin component of MazEF toxin-antitoxin module